MDNLTGALGAQPLAWPEIWGSVADWVVAIAAVAGLAFGLLQLRRIAEANKAQAAAYDAQVNIARAQLILEIDARFESPDMLASRLAIRTLRNHCEKKARGMLRPGANDREVLACTATLFSEEMTALHQRFKAADPPSKDAVSLANQPDDSSGDRYFTLIRLPNWMETIGMLTRDGLLLLDDVLKIYDAVFIGVLTCFEKHIHDRRTDAPLRNDRFLEHAMWVKHQAERREAELDEKARDTRHPKRPGLFKAP